MPHQCLQCGKLFADGSTDLLRGCPGCSGTRFFFTREAIDATARTELASKAGADVKEMLTGLLKSGERPDWSKGIWSREAWEQWVRLEHVEPDGPAPEPLTVHEPPAVEAPPAPKRTLQAQLGTTEAEAPVPDLGDEPAAAAPSTAHEARDESRRPETVRIAEPGSYELDIERLVEKAPIIVEKDGVYMVHLPSVFESGRGGRRKR